MQDVVRARVPGARCTGVRRAGRAAGVRGVGRRPDGERGLARLRPGRTRGRRAPGHRCGPDRRVRDRGDGRLRPRRPVHPPGLRGAVGGRPTGGPGHDRGAVRRTGRRGDRAERVQPAAAVAEGPRAHHGDHRRAWPGRAADPVRHRGVRLRLRDRPRSPDARRDRHPAAARREVPRLGARHERVPLPGHRPGPAGLAHHLDRAHLRGLHRTGVARACRNWTRCWAAASTAAPPC